MSGTVYLMQSGDALKVGFTAHSPQSRLRQLQGGNPARISLVETMTATMVQEKMFHAAFSDDRLAGEWFKDTPVLRKSFSLVARCAKGISTLPPKSDAGMMLLAHAADCGVSAKYPDGSKHCETDWDGIAALIETAP